MKNEAGAPLLMMLEANESRYLPTFNQQFIELAVQNSFMGMSYIYSNYHRQFIQALISKHRNYFQNKRLIDTYCNNTFSSLISKADLEYNKVLFSCPRQISNKMRTYESIYQNNLCKLKSMYRAATELFKNVAEPKTIIDPIEQESLGDAPNSNKIRYLIVRAHEEQQKMIMQL